MIPFAGLRGERWARTEEVALGAEAPFALVVPPFLARRTSSSRPRIRPWQGHALASHSIQRPAGPIKGCDEVVTTGRREGAGRLRRRAAGPEGLADRGDQL